MTVMVVALGGVVAAVLLLLWVRRRWLRVEIVGESMSPTFHPGDRVLARKVDPGLVRTGDIVVIEGPAADTDQFAARISRWQSPYQVVDRDVPVSAATSGLGQRMIKRVAATAGERLPFAVPEYPVGAVVPAGRLAVVGDNPAVSVDSRHHGFISVNQVVGRVVRTPASRSL